MSRSLLHCFFGGRKRRPTRRGTAPRRSYLPRLHAFEDRVLLNAYTVTTLADSGDGSLRQAILGADQAGGDNTITFAVTGTLNLESALPDLTSNISMQGPGTALLTVQRDTAPGTPAFGILTVSGSFTVTLSGMTIANGSSLYGGGVFNNGGSLTVQDSTLVDNHAWRGGGICNFGTLAVSASTLANNSADNNGGGIANFGPLTIDHSMLSGNYGGSGGAVYNFGTAQLTLTYSTLSANHAASGGGIANNSGTVLVDSSAVAYNTAQAGGGIFNPFGGTVIVSNSTIADNTATYSDGGGIANHRGAVLAVSNTTIAGNAAMNGGGIANAGTMSALDTILAGNTAATGRDLSGDLGSLGHNLIGNVDGGSGFAGTDLLYVDPLLGLLQNNGGPTWTMALLSGSPALGAGDTTHAPQFDQRGPGFARVVNGAIDIGAFEFQGSAPGGSHHAGAGPLVVSTLVSIADALPAPQIAGAAAGRRVTEAPAFTQERAALDWCFAAAERHVNSGFPVTRIALGSAWAGRWVNALTLEGLRWEGDASS